MQCLLKQNRNKKVFGISNELLIGGVGTLKTQLADKKKGKLGKLLVRKFSFLGSFAKDSVPTQPIIPWSELLS